MSKWVEDFDGFRIEINRISDERFKRNDFDEGFGWTFQVFSSSSNIASFTVVLKSFQGKRVEKNIQRALEVGKNIVQDKIKKGNFEITANYCYKWEPNVMPVAEVDCKSIDSPADY